MSAIYFDTFAPDYISGGNPCPLDSTVELTANNMTHLMQRFAGYLNDPLNQDIIVKNVRVYP